MELDVLLKLDEKYAPNDMPVTPNAILEWNHVVETSPQGDHQAGRKEGPSFRRDEKVPVHPDMAEKGQLNVLANGQKYGLAGGAGPVDGIRGERGHPSDEKVESVVGNAFSLEGFLEAGVRGGDRSTEDRDVE